jgi:PAS domain S-box-containing protein
MAISLFNCKKMPDQRKKTKPQNSNILDSSFRVLAETSPTGIYLTDNTGQCLYVNPAWCKMAGLTPKEAFGDGWIRAIHPDDSVRIFSEWNDFVKGNIPWESEYRFKDAGGNITWVYGTATLFKRKDGLIEGVIGVNLDITDRHLGEEVLRKSHALLDATFDSLNDAIFILNDQAVVVECNRAASRIFGYRQDEIQGQTTAFLHVDESALAEFRQHLYSATEAEERLDLFEFRMKRRDGTTFATEHSVIPLVNVQGRRSGWVSVVRDITDRKKMEIDLIASEENLSGITSNTPDHIIVQDNKLRYTFVVNPQLGFTKEQYIGSSDFDIGLSEKDAVHLTSIKRKVLETGNPVKVEVPLKNLSGNTEYFEGSLIPKFDTEGKVNGLIGYFRNVTIQKKSIESIKKYQKKLLSLTRHLEEVRENERYQIAMNLHDDLGQRLTSLNLDLGWLKRRIGVQSQGVREKMDEMNQSILETIESIKEVSSFLRPSILYELGLISAFTEQLRKIEKQSGIKCHFSYKPEAFIIDDRISLIIYRVLQESLTNIIRHSEASRIEVILILRNNRIELTIKDNGMGIDNDKVNSLTSMGIAGMMERVKSINGTLSVVGKKGAGTTLVASIPLKKHKNHD